MCTRRLDVHVKNVLNYLRCPRASESAFGRDPEVLYVFLCSFNSLQRAWNTVLRVDEAKIQFSARSQFQ